MNNQPAGASAGVSSRPRGYCDSAAPSVRATPVTPAAAEALVGADDRGRVGLAGRHVHLRYGESQKQHRDRQRQVGHEGHEDEQQVRGDVGEDHGAEQADAAGDGGGRQRGEAGQDVGRPEDGAERGVIGPEAHLEPLDHGGLNHEAAREGVEGEQPRQPEHHVARTVQAEEAGAPPYRGRLAERVAGRSRSERPTMAGVRLGRR